eukprot:1195360-Prorocentrum_minimum.AAC.7
MFELFYWTTDANGVVTFWSSLMGITHNFRTSDGTLASPVAENGDAAFALEGDAGIPSTFGIQARDRFGNLVNDTGLDLRVELIDKFSVAMPMDSPLVRTRAS